MRRLCISFLVAALAVPVFAQGRGEVFEDPEGKYKVNLMGGWIGVVSKDGLGRFDVKVINGVNENGLLRIRRFTVDEATTPLIYAKRDEDQTLRFMPGYAKGTTEEFRGGVDGALVTYDYTVSGRAMLGRVYYIKVNPTTLFSLRFAGLRNVLGPIRNQTDTIARSIKGE